MLLLQPAAPPDTGDVDLLDAMDPDQRAAVHCVGEVVRVLGGPGSGKTTVAAQIVADRVAGGAPASSCVVIASSRVAAARLRSRITAALGVTTTEPLARTLPAFAYGLLRAAAVATSAPLPRLLSGAEQDVILGELLRGHEIGSGRAPRWPADLTEALSTRGFRAELRELLMRAVEHGLTPGDLAELGRRHEMPAWVAAADMLAEYDEVTALSRPGAFDPAWILGAAADLLDNDEQAQGRVRADVALLVIDDAQELTAAGARLVEAVSRLGVRVVLIGDPDAAVQTFRGADPTLIAGRWALLADAPTTVLRTRWRQPLALAALSSRVTEHIGALGVVAHRQQMPPPPKVGAPTAPDPAAPDDPGSGAAVEPAPAAAPADAEGVQVAVVASPAQEGQLIATRLRRLHLQDGLPWSQMAIIVRGSARTASLRRVLSNAGVPVAVPGAQVALRDEPAVRPLLLLFDRVLRSAMLERTGEPGSVDLDLDDVLDLLHSPVGGLDALGLRRLRRELRRRELDAGGTRSSDELLVAAARGEIDTVADTVVTGPLARISRAVQAGRDAAAMQDCGAWEPTVSCETVLWAIWQATGLADGWRRSALAGGGAGARADRDLDAVVALFDAAARYVDRLPMRGPDGFLDHVVGQEVAADSLAAGAPREHCVTLTTPAGAAGQEWDVVVVAGVQEGVWPDLRLRGSLLGSERLQDVLSGRATSLAGAQRSVRHDELRLFRCAVSRARRHVLVTAVQSQDESPSMFLDLVQPLSSGTEERALTPVSYALSFPAVVGELRRRAAFAPDPGHRELAAARLADLVDRGVAGADPEHWWSTRDVSDPGPRRPEKALVPVSPSRLETFLQCELRWLLVTSGGESGHPVGAMAVGTLVHEIAAEVDNGDEAALHAELQRRWPDLGLAPGWLATRTYELATTMLTRLARYDAHARAQGWQVVGRELDARVPIGRAELRGRVDRLERDPDGRLRVVDLKTGSGKPTAAELPQHPQLGAYQAAVEHAAFPAFGSTSGGAALVQLGKAAGVKVTTQEQPALAQADDPTWAERLVDRAAARMAGAHFMARPGDWCRTCPALICCPAKAEGQTL